MIKITRDVKTFRGNTYITEIALGLFVTLKHAIKNLFNIKKMPVIDYPNTEKEIPKGYRGIHRLTKRENGEPRCVACMMCVTACPANCINIVAKENDNPQIEKCPDRFDIDLLECVFCGMCVEACPVDAIRMDSGIYTMARYSRSNFLITKDELLAIEPKTNS